MGNADVLVPDVLSLNDWIDAAIKVENFLKTEEGVKAEDPVDRISSWLGGQSVNDHREGRGGKRAGRPHDA